MPLNDDILQARLKHQKDAERKGAAASALAIALLDETEPAVQAAIESFLSTYSGVAVNLASPVVQASAARLHDDIAAIRGAGFAQVFGLLSIQAATHIDWSLDDLTALYQRLTGLGFKPAIVDIAGIVNTPFLGRDLQTWINDLADADARRISTQVMLGLVRRLPRKKIVRAAIGSKSLDGADGVTNVTRRNLDGIIGEAVFAFGALASAAWATDNAEDFPRELYVAVLDSQTTVICRSLNGNVYLVGVGPIPPLHWGCRSIRISLPRAGDLPNLP